MALQTATPAPRRPLPRLPTQRRTLHVDPPNTFIAGGHSFAREPERPAWIATADPELAALPVAPLAAPAPRTPLSRKWMAAIAASVALHVAVAAFFIVRGASDEAQIAGGEESGLLLLGNAPQDQVMSGEMTLDDATQITIVPIQDAKPVETVEAEAVQPVETAEAAEPVEMVAQAVTADTLQPVREQPVARVTPQETAPVTPDRAAPAQNADEATPIAPVEALPEVLATDTPELVEDDNVVAPVATAPQPPVDEPQESVQAAPDQAIQPVPEQAIQPVPEQAIQPVPEQPNEPEAVVAEVLEEMAEPIERPKRIEPTPEPKRAEARKPPVEKPAAKPAPKAEQPARKAEKRAGSGGRNQADARRGLQDGDANGTKTSRTGQGKASAAGNAAVTNYPGRVRSQISRAVKRISRRDRAGAERDVHVAFTVTASGGLGGVSIARSSGSSALDSAAVAAVRRAAPFPPIPEGAGRRTWQFTIPLGLAR